MRKKQWCAAGHIKKSKCLYHCLRQDGNGNGSAGAPDIFESPAMVSLTRTGIENLLRSENRAEPWLMVLTSERSRPLHRRPPRSPQRTGGRNADLEKRVVDARESSTDASESSIDCCCGRGLDNMWFQVADASMGSTTLLHGPWHASLRERRKSRETLGS